MQFVSQAQGTVRLMAGEVPQNAHFGPLDDAHGHEHVRIVLGGGIGAGKSTVAGEFAAHGFGVIVADDLGREVLAPGSPAVEDVARRWPSVVEDGVVDRQALADIVFSDPQERVALEAITHPLIAQMIDEALRREGDRPMIIETPVQAVGSAVAGRRVAVVADREIRLARAVSRGNDPDDVRRRMDSQPSDADWTAWAEHVIDNSGSWAGTQRTVESLVEMVVSNG